MSVYVLLYIELHTHTEQEINSLSLALFKTFYSSPLRYLALHKVLNRINEVNTEESKQNVFLIAHSVEREIGDFLHKTTSDAISELTAPTNLLKLEYFMVKHFHGRHPKLHSPIGPHYWEPSDFFIFFKNQ